MVVDKHGDEYLKTSHMNLVDSISWHLKTGIKSFRPGWLQSETIYKKKVKSTIKVIKTLQIIQFIHTFAKCAQFQKKFITNLIIYENGNNKILIIHPIDCSCLHTSINRHGTAGIVVIQKTGFAITGFYELLEILPSNIC